MTGARHPLDPLTAVEIEGAVRIARAQRSIGPEVLFVRVQLEEPPRDAVLRFREGDPVDRRAFLILRDRRARATIEAVRAHGGTVLGVLSVVDREEGGREAIEAAGVPVKALATRRALLARAANA